MLGSFKFFLLGLMYELSWTLCSTVYVSAACQRQC